MSTAAAVKIQHQIGEGSELSFKKLNNDYENVWANSKKTKLVLPINELEKVLSNKTLKEQLIDTDFQTYLQRIIRNLLVSENRDRKKLNEYKTTFQGIAVATESTLLEQFLKETISIVNTLLD